MKYGYAELDRELPEIQPKDIVLLGAASGHCKSAMLQNIGANLLKQNLHVLHIDLEMSHEVVTKRYRSIIGPSPDDGRLHIKNMPVGTHIDDIDSYLQGYIDGSGLTPDVIIIDFLGIMTNNIGLYMLAEKYNVVIIGAVTCHRNSALTSCELKYIPTELDKHVSAKIHITRDNTQLSLTIIKPEKSGTVMLSVDPKTLQITEAADDLPII